MSDRKVTTFPAFKWNSDSTLLATHDSGAKHSKLNIYRVSKSGSATLLEVPDLLAIAPKKLGIPTATVSSSGQTPMRWWTPGILEVSVGVTTPTLSAAKAVQLLKGNSSKWIHDTFEEHSDFEWQEDYEAFSISVSGVEDTTHYLQGQAEHHRKTSFKQEIETFLKKHRMEYVERDLE